MRKYLRRSVLLLACLMLPVSAGSFADPAPREAIEWCDIWIPHANESALPRVLLIGDSIAGAYNLEVEKRLEGRAYVARLTTSAFVADPILLAQLVMVLDQYRFDVVQFNNGMHGWQHGEVEYGRALPVFVDTIHRHAPRAKLLWASTTSVRESAAGKADEPTNARIDARNAIAVRVMKRLGIAVNDLHAVTSGHSEYHGDNVHFTAQGIAVQADQVVEAIGRLLPQ